MIIWRNPRWCSVRILTLLTVIMAVVSCSGSDSESSGGVSAGNNRVSIEPIEANIKTTIPIAYSASVAMAVVSDSASIASAWRSNTCDDFTVPCLAIVRITLEPGDLPIALDEYGEITVIGLWTSADNAILTILFNDLRGGSTNYPFLSISTIPVIRANDRLLIVYGGIDIDIDTGSSDADIQNDLEGLSPFEREQELDRVDTPVSQDPELNIGMDAWVITVDTKGTAVLEDDDYSITGGGQYIGLNSVSTSVLQLALVDMKVSADCALNPISGLSVLNELYVPVGSSAPFPKLGAASFMFQPVCDGTARVLAAIGTYGIYIGDDIDLNL